MRFANGNAAAFDQSQCILRPVGTSGKADAVMGQVVERRQDMTTPAQGNQPNGNGYNPPSLFGMQTGAPYLVEHYGTLAPNFLKETDAADRAAKVEQLVQFLLSIDEDAATTTVPVPAGPQGGNFCSQ